jgi:hypothetical protein
MAPRGGACRMTVQAQLKKLSRRRAFEQIVTDEGGKRELAKPLLS